MTHQIDNALLMHGEEPAIPYPTLLCHQLEARLAGKVYD